MKINNLFNAFFQGKNEELVGAGNCASIALIKAAMAKFGMEVLECVLTKGLYKVKFRNGERIEFT